MNFMYKTYKIVKFDPSKIVLSNCFVSVSEFPEAVCRERSSVVSICDVIILFLIFHEFKVFLGILSLEKF